MHCEMSSRNNSESTKSLIHGDWSKLPESIKRDALVSIPLRSSPLGLVDEVSPPKIGLALTDSFART